MVGSKEWWPLNGSLNYYTILQLESFCKKVGKDDEFLYIQVLMDQDEKKQDGCHFMVQIAKR